MTTINQFRISFLFLFYSFFLCFLNYNNVNAQTKIEVQDQYSSFDLELEYSSTLFDLCKLKIGEEYYLQLIDQNRADPVCSHQLILSKATILNNANNGFIATHPCMQIEIKRFDCKENISSVFPRLDIIQVENINTSKQTPMLLNRNLDAEYLVKEVLMANTCGEVFNIIAKGELGTFTGGSNSINIEEGLILSNAPLEQMQGGNPGTAQGGATGQGIEEGSDADLALLTQRAMRDAAVIEFDFIPVKDSISFSYVFASDEYCDYAGSVELFNDAFGFFLSGPDINDVYSNNGKNIATLPNSNDYVSINNVHWYSPYSQYYVSNINPSGEVPPNSCAPTELAQEGCCLNETPFDGFTTVLTAESAVVPCETYQIKLVVADAVDNIFGSAVFIRSNSFDLGQDLDYEIVFNSTGGNYIYEGCGDSTGVVQFVRNDEGTVAGEQALNIEIDILGNATNNQDYNITFDSIIEIPSLPNSSFWFEEITVFSDTLVEQNEWVQFDLDTACECDQENDNLGFTIIDVPPIEVKGIIDLDYCTAQLLEITPQIKGGLPEVAFNGDVFEYTYQWLSPNGLETDSLGLSYMLPDSIGTYQFYFSVFDDCGTTVTDTLNVTISNLQAIIEYENQVFNCSNTPPAYEVVASGGVEPYTYLWADGSTGVTPASLGNSFGQVTVTDAVGCTATAHAELIEDFEEPVFDLSTTPITCLNPTGTATATVTNAIDFIIIWTNEAGQGISISETVEVDVVSQVCATVTNNENGCMSTECVEILENIIPPSVSLAVSNIIDCIDTTATIITNVSGQGEIMYDWFLDDEPIDLSSGFVVSDVGIYTVIITDAENGCTATESIEVIQDESVPEISLMVLDTITCNNPSATIQFVGSQGTNFVSTWMFNNESFDMPDNLEVEQSGTYNLVITNTDTGCSTEASVEVIENLGAPVFEVSSTMITCIEPQAICEIILSDTIGTYIQQWNFEGGEYGFTFGTIFPNEPGNYCFLVTDPNNGCSTQECIEVLENTTAPSTSLSVSNELNCQDTTATILVDGQNQNVTYEWTFNIDPTAVNADFIVSESGTFTLITTDNENGCTSLASIEVVDISTEVTANAGEDIFIELDCGEIPDYPITIDATSTDNQSQYEYQWILNNDTLPNSNTLLFDIFETGMYVLEVTDTNNFCSDTDTVLVDIVGANFPDAIITGDGSLNCDQDLIVLSAGSSTSNSEIIDFQWFNPQGAMLSTAENQAVAQEGIYSVIVTNAEGCTNQEVFEVVLDTIDAVIVGDGRLNCFQEEVVLDATNSTSTVDIVNYQWFDPEGALISTDNSLTVVEAGYYSVIVTNVQGCTDQQLIQVIEDEIDVTFNNGIPLCFDDEITLNVDVVGSNPPFMLEWSNGETGDSIVISMATIASLTVTDSIGCTWTITPENIDFPLPLFVQNIDIIDETDNNADGSISIDASGGSLPYSYLWNTGETTQTIGNLSTGLYAVTVTDANDCEFIIDAILVDMMTGTNLIPDSNIQISPNPTNGLLNIEYRGSSFIGSINLYNQLGQKVYQQNQFSFRQNDSYFHIPTSLIGGMYILSIEENGAPVYFEKIILNR